MRTRAKVRIKTRALYFRAYRKRRRGEIGEEWLADLTVIDPNRPYVIRGEEFRSMGKATPFEGWPVSASVVLTVCGGEVVYGALNNGGTDE